MSDAAEKDYADMRRFQAKFIEADQECKALQADKERLEAAVRHFLSGRHLYLNVGALHTAMALLRLELAGSPDPVREMKPHSYAPSYQHMGDCMVCGHVEDAPLHQPDPVREAEKSALGNLLAIIHRDGGHHTGKVGIEQSVADAHQVWASLQYSEAAKEAVVKAAMAYSECPTPTNAAQIKRTCDAYAKAQEESD